MLGAGVIEGVRVDGRLASVAVWMQPGAHPVPLRRELAMVPAWLRLLTMHARAVPGLLRASPALDRLRPRSRTGSCACSARSRRCSAAGCGTVLVEQGLRRASGDAVPVHLDTGARSATSTWFRRFGFEVADEVQARARAPPPISWGMRTRRGSRT